VERPHPIVTLDAANRFAEVSRIAKTVHYRSQIARAEPNVITDEDDPERLRRGAQQERRGAAAGYLSGLAIPLIA
jgi:hypothetical protein